MTYIKHTLKAVKFVQFLIVAGKMFKVSTALSGKVPLIMETVSFVSFDDLRVLVGMYVSNRL